LGFGFYRLCLIFGKKKARGNLAGFPSFGSIINQRQTLFFYQKNQFFIIIWACLSWANDPHGLYRPLTKQLVLQDEISDCADCFLTHSLIITDTL